MNRPEEADLSELRTVPVAGRPEQGAGGDFARPPAGDASFAAFLDSLPDILEARSFRAVVDALVTAARGGRG